ncbi:hypothetical protein ACFLWH_02470, partial [Chloroflexota bacterium]
HKSPRILIWDFPFQFVMRHPDLHCFVTNNMPVVPCCQSPLRGHAIASSTSEPYTPALGTLVRQRWQSIRHTNAIGLIQLQSIPKPH